MEKDTPRWIVGASTLLNHIYLHIICPESHNLTDIFLCTKFSEVQGRETCTARLIIYCKISETQTNFPWFVVRVHCHLCNRIITEDPSRLVAILRKKKIYWKEPHVMLLQYPHCLKKKVTNHSIIFEIQSELGLCVQSAIDMKP